MTGTGRDIDVDALVKMRADGIAHTLLDVREPDEIAIAAIADSLAIPMQLVPQSLDILPRDQPLIVLCHHGMRSGMAADFLRSNGFDNARNLAGGIDEWARRIEPQMRRY
jgi:rhodanese-related sulfurtransferase